MILKNFKNLHFIGIGGISMSGLAEILKNQGYNISGSDAKSSELIDSLAKKGITIYIGHFAENIKDNIDLVVYTAAIPFDNVEILEAEKKGVKCIERSQLLGVMMKDYRNTLCVAGTHGKTTTSSMLAEVFLASQNDPTISIGGILSSINSNYRVGKNEYFIVESCEYHNSFLEFLPSSAIILNLDRDHTDFFETLDDSYASFRKFAELIPEFGALVINGEIPNLEKITKDIHAEIIIYGSTPEYTWYPENIVYNEFGCAEYDICKQGSILAHVTLNVPGFHNVLNSLAVFALSDFYKIEKESILKGLLSFKGTARRFEYKGTINGAKIIDDYAHHPTEILATLKAAKANKINRLICAFQPHTYSRTKSLLNEFAECFDLADNILVLDIYAAREKDPGDIHSTDLVDKLKERGKEAIYVESFQQAKDLLLSTLSTDDMLITLGAGNINFLGNSLISG